ncbi:MAG TPA: superoxide dismutase [Allosphingosinicella sp.]|nr:superoxide dismutase [Allosphingosinicella sp.]
MPFTLPPLPYADDALEPTIDAATMRLHHGKHHQAYVDKLNEAVAEDPRLEGSSLEEILASVSGQPKKVRNNGGGHWNHSFFWETMAPGAAGRPNGRLAETIDAEFGSFEALRTKFNEAGVGQFGSGWVWLLVDQASRLSVATTPNQDNPLMDDAATKGIPILGNDLWEHAYYLKYNNRRADYLAAWWDVVNWEKAGERFEAAAA